MTSNKVAGFPQYTIDVSDWKAGSEVAGANFAFAPPADAKKLGPDDLPDFDELPSNFTPGAK